MTVTPRLRRAITEEAMSVELDAGTEQFVVEDKTGTHTVDMHGQTACDCEDSRLTLPDGVLCAHRIRVRLAAGADSREC